MRLTRVLLPAVLLALVVPGSLAAVCRSSSGCEFWDNNYHEYVLYEEDTTKIDILIVPSVAAPFPLRDVTIAKLAVDEWKRGINDYGATWFKSAMDINAYGVGIDTDIPGDAISDPEIIVVMSEHDPVLLFGIGLQSPISVCTQQGGVQSMGEPHVHDGVFVQQIQCQSGGYVCLALNTNFLLGGTVRMFDLIGHEVGHCLGPGHVGDALDFDAKTTPPYDMMSYMYSHQRANCVSNLNIRVMEGIYAPLLGQPSSIWLEPGDYYAMSPSLYQPTTPCPVPFVPITG